jgi:hypothetical protein
MTVATRCHTLWRWPPCRLALPSVTWLAGVLPLAAVFKFGGSIRELVTTALLGGLGMLAVPYVMLTSYARDLVMNGVDVCMDSLPPYWPDWLR